MNDQPPSLDPAVGAYYAQAPEESRLAIGPSRLEEARTREIDAARRLVGIARERNRDAAHSLASCTVGDARAVSEPDESADVVLLLGPLYHLVDAPDRHRALVEAARVLRPGGLLIAAAISRWASALDGLSRDLLESEPAMLGSSAHLLVVANKPTSRH